MMPIFDQEVLDTIEKIIGIPFIEELYLEGSVCFANNDEVRSEFRQTFNVSDVINYVNAIIFKSQRNRSSFLLDEAAIEIPYPSNSSFFWEQVTTGKKLRESALLKQYEIKSYFEINWYRK